MMKISKNEVIDPTYKGNLARFINHSCDPNCITQKWNVLGETCIGIFAIRDIEENQELTFDYQFDSYKTPLTKCLCGSKNCKGYLGYIPTQFTIDEWEERLEHLPCKLCGGNQDDDDDKLLLCDLCNQGFHTFCLVPPLDHIPKDAWFCDECKEEMANQDQREQEKKKLDLLKDKKTKTLKTQKRLAVVESDSEENDLVDKFSQEYEDVYKFQKNLEKEAIDELYEMKDEDAEQLKSIKLKKKKIDSATKKKQKQLLLEQEEQQLLLQQ